MSSKNQESEILSLKILKYNLIYKLMQDQKRWI